MLFLTDPDRTHVPWEVAARLPKGAGVVFRAFSRPDAEEVGHRIRRACDQSGAVLLVGRDPDLARAIHADGIHLPEADMEKAAVLAAQNPDWLITAALHAALGERSPEGIDAFVVSPVFPAGGASASKQDLGLQAFNDIVETLPCPAYALGGIKADNAHLLLDTQACGIAAIDAIQTAFIG